MTKFNVHTKRTKVTASCTLILGVHIREWKTNDTEPCVSSVK
jgi:hypothetical protein